MTLQTTLQAISSQSQALEAVLTQECTLLAETSPDTELLRNLAEEKSRLMHELEKLSRQRSQAIAASGEADPGLPDALKACLARCQQMNVQAGAFINSQLRYANRALDILGLGLGEATYSADGSNYSKPGSHSLAKA